MSQKHPYELPERYGDPQHPTHPETGHSICAAYKRGGQLNRFGDPVCLGSPVTGRTRCRVHGGLTPTGIAAPRYEGKGESRVMRSIPAKLRQNYDEATSDPQIGNVVSETALLDARLMELLSNLDTAEAGALWLRLREHVDALETARQAGNAQEVAVQVTLMSALIKRGASDSLRWREVYEVVDRKRKLAETMRRIRRDTMQFITTEQLIMMIDKVGTIIQQNVSDPQVLRQIASGIARLTSGGGNNGA